MDDYTKYLIRLRDDDESRIREIMPIVEEDEEFIICKRHRKPDAVFRKKEVYIPISTGKGYQTFGFDENLLEYIMFKVHQDQDIIQRITRIKNLMRDEMKKGNKD